MKDHGVTWHYIGWYEVTKKGGMEGYTKTKYHPEGGTTR